MGRLIDADKLKHAIHCAYSDDLEILEKIDEQPTAFDVDEVMEQLKREESAARSELLVDRKTAFEFSSKCRLEAYEKAIEIVKGGGVE